MQCSLRRYNSAAPGMDSMNVGRTTAPHQATRTNDSAGSLCLVRQGAQRFVGGALFSIDFQDAFL